MRFDNIFDTFWSSNHKFGASIYLKELLKMSKFQLESSIGEYQDDVRVSIAIAIKRDVPLTQYKALKEAVDAIEAVAHTHIEAINSTDVDPLMAGKAQQTSL